MEASGGSDPPPRPGRRSSLEDAHDEEAARRRVSLEDPYVEAQQGEEDDGVAEAEAGACAAD